MFLEAFFQKRRLLLGQPELLPGQPVLVIIAPPRAVPLGVAIQVSLASPPYPRQAADPELHRERRHRAVRGRVGAAVVRILRRRWQPVNVQEPGRFTGIVRKAELLRRHASRDRREGEQIELAGDVGVGSSPRDFPAPDVARDSQPNAELQVVIGPRGWGLIQKRRREWPRGIA